MRRKTFELILSRLGPHLQRKATNFNPEPTTPAQQLAYCLYFLAQGCTQAAAASSMRTSPSNLNRAVAEVPALLVEHFADVIVWPNQAEKLRIAAGFYKRCMGKFGTRHGLPQIIGAMDGTHVASWIGHYNRKSFKSFNVLGVCDHRGQFLHVVAGEAGNMHDSTVFKGSGLCDELETGDKGRGMWIGRKVVAGVHMPYSILADSAYAMHTFVTPAMQNTAARRSPTLRTLNIKIASTRNIIERAFGRLKARWRCLIKGLDLKDEAHVTVMIMACFILHNICERANEPLPIDAEGALRDGGHDEDEQRRLAALIAGLNLPIEEGDEQAYLQALGGAVPERAIPRNHSAHGRAVRDALERFVNLLM
jgi:hypothetical protein